MKWIIKQAKQYREIDYIIVKTKNLPIYLKKIIRWAFLPYYLVVISIKYPIYCRRYKRLENNNHIIKINSRKLFLPNITKEKCDFFGDYIQLKIFFNNSFYEEKVLKYLLKNNYINHCNTILDIGANIGNHTVFFAMQEDTKMVYSFEPSETTCQILKKNITINNLEEKVKVFQMALTDEKNNYDICEFDKYNLGCLKLKSSQNGNIIGMRCDDLDFDSTVDFIKIDVEGMELCVLKGAKNTIILSRPIIFIEIWKENFNATNSYLLDELDYTLVEALDDDNYIYMYLK